MSPYIGADGASHSPAIAWPLAATELQRLADQVEVLNRIALLSVTAPAEARQLLVRTLPLCDVHPSLNWIWQVLLHHSGQRAHALAVAEMQRVCGMKRVSS